MAKSKSNFNPKHFALVLGSVLSVIAIVVLVSASQQKTQTESNASELAAKCRTNPTFTSSGTTFGTDSVTYIYKVGYPSGACKNIRYGVNMKTPSDAWEIDYRIDGGSWVSEYTPPYFAKGVLNVENKSDTVRIRVKAPPKASGPYNLTAKACAAYTPASSETLIMSLDPAECITLKARYVAD